MDPDYLLFIAAASIVGLAVMLAVIRTNPMHPGMLPWTQRLRYANASLGMTLCVGALATTLVVSGYSLENVREGLDAWKETGPLYIAISIGIAVMMFSPVVAVLTLWRIYVKPQPLAYRSTLIGQRREYVTTRSVRAAGIKEVVRLNSVNNQLTLVPVR